MGTGIDTILRHKQSEIRSLPRVVPMRVRALHDPTFFIRRKPIIAEVKKASPSSGIINADADPGKMAGIYRAAGAGAISVLTDREFFGGGFHCLESAAAAVDIPLLCKDFILSEIQIEHAWASGADFILLIASILSEIELGNLSRVARSLGMDVLFEIHEAGEFDKLHGLELTMVGVNSRNLATFAIDREYARDTLRSLRGEFLKIAESGISNEMDIREYREAGADAFLVGTALMNSSDPAALLGRFHSAAVAPCS